MTARPTGPRVKPGDVFQILTSRGVCYGLVTHRNPTYKYVVAVFRETYDTPPSDYAAVVVGEPQFITTFLIGHAVRQGLFRVVAHVDVPPHLRPFPTFRNTNHPNGDLTLWFFWDGERETRVQRPLTEAEQRYPVGPTLPSAPLLIERIEKNWRGWSDNV